MGEVAGKETAMKLLLLPEKEFPAEMSDEGQPFIAQSAVNCKNIYDFSLMEKHVRLVLLASAHLLEFTYESHEEAKAEFDRIVDYLSATQDGPLRLSPKDWGWKARAQ
jgi:hypothetical protein